MLGSLTVSGQTKTVRGTIRDTQGEPLAGVTVIIPGTTTGTMSDAEGIYTIQAKEGDILRVSFVGFAPQETTVGSSAVIDFTLAEDIVALEDIVVVGYGTQKKQTVVGAVSQTSNQEIVRAAKGANVTDGLSGLMPGVIVLQKSGARGGARIGESSDLSEIIIRGKSTWNSSAPLVLVDGVERDMNTIDPQEIESLSVLKDASATAVFGVRGANGVILVTTRRGSESKPKLSFDLGTTAESISRMPMVLGSYEALTLRNYAVLQTGPVSPDAWNYFMPDPILEYYRTQQYPLIYSDTDWTDLMTKDIAWNQRYNMNIKGGTKFVKYFASLGYLNQGDLLSTADLGTGYNPAFSYDRFNFRTNLDFDITGSTRFSVNLQGIYADQQEPGGGDIEQQGLYRGLFRKPHDQPYPMYDDGTFGDSGGQYERFGANPYAFLNMSGLARQTRTEVNVDFSLTQDLQKLLKGLKVSARLSNDSRTLTNGPNISEEGYTSKYIDPDIITANPQTAADSALYIFYTTPDESAKHGYYYVDKPYSMSNESGAVNSIYRHTYFNTALNYSNNFGVHSVTGLATINVDQAATGSNFPTRRIEYIGRATYAYDGTYLVELNGSRTGTNKFGPERRYDNFYSAAAGWVISNEGFIKNNLRFINNLKLRFSYGTVGNDNVALTSQYPYLSIPTLTSSYMQFLNTSGTVVNSSYSGNVEGAVANPNIQWETAAKSNAGIEFGIFENLISGTFEYFTEHRQDMLVPSNQRLNADFVGAPAPPANVGETEMHGYEIELKVQKNFNKLNTWLRLTHTHAIDNVIYKEDPPLRPDYQKAEGHQIGQNYSVMNQYIVQNWDELYTGVLWTDRSKFLPGDYRQVDYNGDGIIDSNDSAPLGFTTRPQNTYSASMGLSWKGLSFMILFYGTYNVSAQYSLNEYDYNSPVIYDKQRDEGWIPELGQTTTALYRGPRLGGTSTGSYWLWDASILRLKNIELAYAFDPAKLKVAKLEGLRFYVSGNNLLLWTDLPEDREGNYGNNEEYPLTKSMTFGATIDF
jgi:TonB-linked SusC/RagA family outer membrane protein